MANFKQYMLNQIVQEMLDVRPDSYQDSIWLSPWQPDLYLELFTDKASCESLYVVTGKGEDSVESLKFQQVFKNCIEEIDDSKILLGKAYGYLNGVVETVFGDSTSLPLVDKSSIQVTRVEQQDNFTYNVHLDLYLMHSNDYLKEKTHYAAFDGRWVVGNAVVKDIECKVTFTPKFTYAAGEMTYDVKYEIVGGEYDTEFSQIVYNLDKKTKHKNVPVTAGKLTIPDNTVIQENGKQLGDITSELVSKNINRVFDGLMVKQILVGVNNAVEPEDMVFQVEKKVALNTLESYETWPLGKPLPTAQDLGEQRLVQHQRGFTVINEDVYEVNEEENLIVSEDAVYMFDIVGLKIHDYKYEYKYEDDTPGDNHVRWSVKTLPEGTSEEQSYGSYYIARGGEVLDQDYLTRNFTIRNYAKDAYGVQRKYLTLNKRDGYGNIVQVLDNLTEFQLRRTAENLKNLTLMEETESENQTYEYKDDNDEKKTATVPITYFTSTATYLMDNDAFETERKQVGTALGDEPFIYEFTQDEWEQLIAG